MQKLGAPIQQRLHLPEVVACATLDHVAGECERAAGKADERDAPLQLAARERDGVEHVTKPVEVGRAQRADGVFVAQRPLELRPLALDEVQAEPHGVGNREDVGKDDRGVEGVAPDRLQGDLARELGRLRQCEETSRLAARLVVLGQVAAGLPHDPDRRVRRGLAQERAQENVVRHGREFSHALTSADRGRRGSLARSVDRGLGRYGQTPEGSCARRVRPTNPRGAPNDAAR